MTDGSSASMPASSPGQDSAWVSVLANDMAVPVDRPIEESVAELVVMLSDPDPSIRDETAYPIVATWIIRGDLDGRLGDLGDEMAVAHARPEIQARTFATLILGAVIRRDAVTGELTDERVRHWQRTFGAWFLDETDLRGWDDRLGWLHAIAHGADTARALAMSPRLGADDLAGLSRLWADRLLRPTSYRFSQGEDARMAYAMATLLCRRDLGDPVGWLEPLHAAIDAGTPGPTPAWAANTIETLTSLYVYVQRGITRYDPVTQEPMSIGLPDAHAEISDRIAGVLRLPSYWLG
jgi:hypothetical protein